MNKHNQEKILFNKKLLITYRVYILLSILESLAIFIIVSSYYLEKIRQLTNPSAIYGVLVFLFLFLLLCLGFLLAESFVKRALIIKINQTISQTSDKTFSGMFLTGLVLIGLVIELLILFPTTEYYQIINQSMFSYKAFAPILILVILLGIQVLGLATYLRGPIWRKIWTDSKLSNLTFVYITLGFTLLYWVILFIQSPILLLIPDWYRALMKQPFTLRHLYFLPFLLLIWWGIHLVFSKSVSITKGMVLLIFFGYCFQVMFGLVAGKGFESIRRSYADRPISHTVSYGCGEMSIIGSIKNYESHYGNSYRVQTKPPGYLVGHKIFAKVTNFLSGSHTENECIYNYTRIGAYLFPFLASLVIIPITYLSKSLFRLKYPLLPGLIYILTPNFMIWVMVVDQVVFPLLFLTNVVLMYLTIKYESFLIAIGLGISIYFSSFISFAMLPTIGLYCLWLTAEYITNKNNRKHTNIIKLFVGFVLGFSLTYLVFYVLLNYNAFSRFQLASYQHRLIKDYSINLLTILLAFITNSVEYFTWTGIPLFFLAASFSISSIKKIINKNHERSDIFSLSCVGMYIALNILSQTHGEVQRMWIFLSPLLVIIAAAEILNRMKNDKRSAIILLLIIQFCTAVWHFQFIRNQYY
ncbi:MAG: hypothetical protein ACC633_06340 [Anaerolineales bacterium]